MAEPNEAAEDQGGPYAAYRQEQQFQSLDQAARMRALSVRFPNEEAMTVGDQTTKGTGGTEAIAGTEEGQPISAAERGGMIMGDVLGAVPKVARDLGRGAIEAPNAVAGGITSALQEFSNALGGVANWLEDWKPLGGLQVFDREGKFDPKYLTPEEQKGQPLPKVAPEIEKPDSVTGTLIRAVAQFAAGFYGTGKLAGLKPATSTAGKVATAQAKGAGSMGIFHDPNHGNLANVINDWAKAHPWAQQPLTEFMATQPEDSEAEKRLKNALVDGLGAGLLAEGLLQGFKLVRAYIRAQRAGGGPPVTALDQAKAQYGEVKPERDFLILGDPDPRAPMLKVEPPAQGDAAAALRAAEVATETGVPGQVTARGVVGSAEEAAARARQGLKPKGAEGADDEAARQNPAPDVGEAAPSGKVTLGEPKLMINFARINAPEDVRQVLADAAEALAPQIDDARRGVRSNEATKEAAQALGLTVEQLLSRRSGQALNAEESLAARRLWAASAEKLLEVAKRASEPNAGAVDLYNFRKMLAVHHAIQSEVLAARAEAARALQQWSIPAGGGVEQARNIQIMLDGMGGQAVSKELAARLSFLADTGADAAALGAAAQKGAMAATMDAVKEAYVMGLLWAPPTHIVNAVSNTMVSFMQIYERAAGRQVSRFMGREAGEGGIAEGEATAMAYAMLMSLRDAMRLAGKALITGEQGLALGQKLDIPPAAISAESFGIGSNTGLGRAVDVIGFTNRIPGRLLGSADEFFKTIGYRMELHAQALRQATEEGLTGQGRLARIAEIVAHPPDNIRISAIDAATYSTFTSEVGDFARAVMQLRNTGEMNPTFIVLPFLRTPANILRYTFERSPLAPLVSQWRADIAAGGARADIALARMATGSAVMAWAADMAYSGYISGSGPKHAGEREALERQDWQPNSIFVGDKWYSYNRADPYGMLFGFAATLAETARYAEIHPDELDEWQEVVAAGAAAVGKQVLDKSYLSGLGRIVAAIEDPERFAPNYVQQLVTGFVPGSSLLRFIERGVDPTEREANDPWQAVQAMVPGISSNLPPKRDLWGRAKAPKEVYGQAYDLLSPVKVTEVKESPIDAAMSENDMRTERIKKKTSFKGVDMDLKQYPEVYDAYVRLAGNELKHPVYKKGAKDLLDDIVTGKHELSEVYAIGSSGKDGGKAQLINRIIQEYRREAADAILRDPQFKAFAAEWRARELERQQRQMPVDKQTGNPVMRLPQLPMTVQ